MTTARLDEIFKSLEGLSPSELSAAVEVKKILKAQDEKSVQPILKAVVNIPEQDLTTVDEINKILAAREVERIQLILKAVENGHIATVRYLLDKKIVDANAHYSWYERPTVCRSLFTAAIDNAIYTSNSAMINMLLNEYKLTPEAINYFARNINSSSTSNEGNALQKAIYAGRIDLVKLLLEKGASSDIDLNTVVGGYTNTFIMYTAKLRRLGMDTRKQIVDLLLKAKKEKLTEKDEIAVEYIHKGIELDDGEFDALCEVRKLIKHHPTVEKLELAALQAAENGYVEPLKFLFEQGTINPNTLLFNEKAFPETLLMASLRSKETNPVATMLLEDEKLDLANLDFCDPQTGNAMEKVVGARNVMYVRRLILLEARPVNRDGDAITEAMDRWYGPEEKRSKDERQITEMLRAYVNRYKQIQINRYADEEQKRSADSVVDVVPTALTNWFFCCRKHKSVMQDKATSTESNEMKEAKKLA